ncbi:OLC1v1016957C1 [Oldenlandia corymbosa var. corymbosa]|uniref:OLC1v1016957C1 n=1 Tax=Oldenlandia corymbosa var. corymbosa TaxID=529605 RepID=A0AAV1E8C5_OLDCO|nr:OLC1v1016957C1 [Oldenlandia corymbosa var. corymbosa]
MRLTQYYDAARNLAKRVLIQHSRQKQHHHRCFSSFSKIFSPCKTSQYRIPRTQNQNSTLWSFVHKSYYSSSPTPPPAGRRMGFLAWYLAMLNSRPIITKAISCSIIYAAADVTSQMITMTPSGSLDLIRTSRMASYGLLILGPSQHVWFNFIGRSLPRRDIVTTLKKLVAGQLLFGPAVTSVFFSFNAALQGEDAGQIAARLKRDLLPTLLNGLMFWPICDFLTYKVIPVHLQVYFFLFKFHCHPYFYFL